MIAAVDLETDPDFIFQLGDSPDNGLLLAELASEGDVSFGMADGLFPDQVVGILDVYDGVQLPAQLQT